MKPTRTDRIMGIAADMSRRKAVLTLGSVAAGIVGLLKPRRGARASVCGVDDSQDVELYSGTFGVSTEFILAHQSPVGVIRWNSNLHALFDDPGNVNARRWCSGTLITEDLFLTASHCLSNRPIGWDVPKEQGTDRPISREELAMNMHAEFNYQLDPDGFDRESQSFPVTELVEDGFGDLDYAILRLANNPGLMFGVAPIGAEEEVAVGTVICIIGHPEGVPKRIAVGSVLEYDGSRIYHDVDTTGGSAGSGILSVTDGAVIGVHTNGGCREDFVGTNHGVSMSALRQGSPILNQLAEA